MGNFERKWQDAFESSEMTPREGVWTGIEAAIANREAAKYKRRVIYYKWIAAAGIVMFMGILGYISFQTGQGNFDQVTTTQEQQTNPTISTDKESSAAGTPNENASSKSTQAGDKSTGKETSGDESSTSQTLAESSASSVSSKEPAARSVEVTVADDENISNRLLDPTLASQDPKEQTPASSQVEIAESSDQASTNFSTTTNENTLITGAENESANQNAGQYNLADPNSNSTRFGNRSVSIKKQLLALTPLKPQGQALSLAENPLYIYGVALHPTETPTVSSGGQLWAGLNLSPGLFDPNYQLGNFESQNLALSDPNTGLAFTRSEETTTGFSIGVALDVGMKIAPKWELKSGLQYFRNSLQSSTNAAINQTPAFSSVVESLDLANSDGDLRFAPTDLDNNFQFISIPVEAGYLLLDRKVRLTINAGVAADFFLKNVISPTNQSLDEVIINPGSNSPFRTVYFNGILGAEASYEILPQYSLTLQPRYKVAINQFTKPDNSYTSLPSAFGIGVGVKYTFK